MWRPWSGVNEVRISDEDCDEVEEDMNTSSSSHLPTAAKPKFLNVFNYLKEIEGENGAIKKTALMTQTPYTSVRRMVIDGIRERKIRKDSGVLKVFQNHHADLIRHMIYDAYKENIALTIGMLHQKVVKDLNVHCCQETLRTFLRKIEFRYRTIDKRQVLMESRRISEWRTRFLKEITEVRAANVPIVYLDETWYDTHDTVKKGWDDGTARCRFNVPPTRGKRIIILHAGSAAGWIDGALLLSAKDMKEAKVDYHENMTAEIFESWFQEKLCPNLPNNSVIVLDNASYHSTQTNKKPNSSSNKDEIKEFLIENDLYFEEQYTKKQLLEVLKTKEFPKIFTVDNMALNRGFKVIRLPRYHCLFNPIEMI